MSGGSLGSVAWVMLIVSRNVGLLLLPSAVPVKLFICLEYKYDIFQVIAVATEPSCRRLILIIYVKTCRDFSHIPLLPTPFHVMWNSLELRGGA